MPEVYCQSHNDRYYKSGRVVVEGTVSYWLEGVLDCEDEVDAEEKVEEEGGYLKAGVKDLVRDAESFQALFWVLVRA